MQEVLELYDNRQDKGVIKRHEETHLTKVSFPL